LIDIYLGKRDLTRYGKVFERFKTWTNNSQDESINEEQLHKETNNKNEIDTNDYSETSNFNGENTHVTTTNPLNPKKISIQSYDTVETITFLEPFYNEYYKSKLETYCKNQSIKKLKLSNEHFSRMEYVINCYINKVYD
ncbi:hypothetical protein COBT_003736, partial [Conglomerata obtusa]